MRENGKKATILIASTYDKLLQLLPPEHQDNFQIRKHISERIESSELRRMSSNLSDLEIGDLSPISGKEILEDQKQFDAGHVFK